MTDKRCAYLTMASTDGWSIDADLGFPPMEAMGWQVDAVPWRTTAPDWDRYRAVYIGVPWDYPEDPQAFLSVLKSIDESKAILVNDLALVHWALPKTYLRDLEAGGAAIVPSIWHDDMDERLLEEAFAVHGTDRIIVKPVISTNATDTYLLTRERARELKSELRSVFDQRPFVVQPFIENIQSEGEFSLFYFNSEFSHATLKVPKAEDFRVQEEHGAEVLSIVPEQTLLQAGANVMRLVKPMPVYARADFVRGPDGRFLVMELELIEPSMYLRMDPDAPRRFAEAFDRYVQEKSGEISP
jgi:hypothetical protein